MDGAGSENLLGDADDLGTLWWSDLELLDAGHAARREPSESSGLVTVGEDDFRRATLALLDNWVENGASGAGGGIAADDALDDVERVEAGSL